MKKIHFFILCTYLFTLNLYSQPAQGTKGIAIGIQRVHTDLNIPWWIGEKLVLSPAFGFYKDSEKATEYDVGVALRLYTKKEKLSPYFGAKYMFLHYSPSTSGLSSVTDHLFGLSFGGEYFIDEHFSIGGELQLNFSMSDKNSNRFGNPGGMNTNTGSCLFACFYF